MAQLSALLGSGIRSIQQGSISLTSQTSNTATITSVVIGKAFVLWNGAATNTSGSDILIALTNATTVTASALSSKTGTVNYTVVEFN